jgi:hypothetical protein
MPVPPLNDRKKERGMNLEIINLEIMNLEKIIKGRL